MEAVKVSGLSFFYPESSKPAVDNITFTVNKGEFVTVCGLSGSGKTTLLRLLKPVTAPYGKLSGKIYFSGNKDAALLTQREQAERIGFVRQSTDNQIVTDKVWHELAFAAESLGWDNDRIKKRVAETASFFGIQHWFESDVSTLSGGQKQILNLASVMVTQPELLILDEPTSQLDPIAASEFLSAVIRINREFGITVIISEHRLEELISESDRVLVLESGRLTADCVPEELGERLKAAKSGMFPALPAPIMVWNAADDGNSKCPMTIAQGRVWLEEYISKNKIYPIQESDSRIYAENSLELKSLWFRYEKNSTDIIKDLSLVVRKGEHLAILGGNGAGKTTLLKLISGALRPYTGKTRLLCGRAALLPQNPTYLFVKNTVEDELKESLSESDSNMMKAVISLCGLSELLQRHPFDLSGGEQQRLALGKILLLNPDILLFDEPTKGLDAAFKQQFALILQALLSAGKTIITVSHDVEFCAAYAHRCALMFGGEIVSQGAPAEFFSDNSFYVTAAGRMSRGLVKGAVTTEDLIYFCTGKSPEKRAPLDFFHGSTGGETESESIKPDIEQKKPLLKWKRILALTGGLLLILGVLVNVDALPFLKSSDLPAAVDLLLIAFPVLLLMIAFAEKTKTSGFEVRQRKTKLGKRTLVSLAIILLAIPLTVFVGVVYLYDQKYLFISLLVMLECMLPFFLIFEGRKPKARELIILAAMCALTVAGRSAFYALPEIKPVLALVIISGVAFGAESGFAVGAVSMLVSNIYFGQGAWTPWQMFAAGIIGFLAGALFKKGMLRRNRGALCVFGFITTVLIYGGIMNFSSFAVTHSDIKLLPLYYIRGFPVDIVHALSTFAFLFFGAEPMLSKLDRVKTKYGLID